MSKAASFKVNTSKDIRKIGFPHQPERILPATEIRTKDRTFFQDKPPEMEMKPGRRDRRKTLGLEPTGNYFSALLLTDVKIIQTIRCDKTLLNLFFTIFDFEFERTNCQVSNN
ncbi:hypothetical protein RUM43_013586 [Polyplax serrata]|uniref:Uncharacterized protein n=1 Tax=Polyplax serrata TaxID=468196 RepID=A0AAN8Q2X8_POLSC